MLSGPSAEGGLGVENLRILFQPAAENFQLGSHISLLLQLRFVGALIFCKDAIRRCG
jgi:hypothetical protein